MSIEPDGRPRPLELYDEQGLIPTFPPAAIDERGRLLPISEEERKARIDASIRIFKALELIPDTDPPGSDEAFLRAIDEGRPHRKLYEGMY